MLEPPKQAVNKKLEVQPIVSTKAPLIRGPNKAPIIVKAIKVPIAFPLLSPTINLPAYATPAGATAAPATPFRKRPITKIQNAGEKATINEPRTIKIAPIRMTNFSPKESPSQPNKG